MKPIEIEEISALNYEGYLWYSDQKQPEYIDNDNLFQMEMLKKHPFVVEGALYSANENISITIRNLDGEYLIHQFDLKELDTENYRKIEHKWLVAKDQARKARMVEVWQLEEDKHELCAKMPSYRPAFWIFNGFTK